MKVRLFRLYDENGQEIGFGIFHPATENIAFAHKDFLGYQAATNIRVALSHCHSFMWCCPNANAWHGHAVMNNLVEEHSIQVIKTEPSLRDEHGNVIVYASDCESPQ